MPATASHLTYVITSVQLQLAEDRLLKQACCSVSLSMHMPMSDVKAKMKLLAA